MLKDNHNPIANVPNPSIKKGTIKDKLLVFLEDTLYKFQEHFKGKVIDSEENLNEQLGKTLSYFSKSQAFIFQAETKQKQPKGIDRRVDIGVFRHFSDPTPFFTIEAKRLTTSMPSNREKEYVLGSDPTKFSGGIERFKHNVHGVNLDHSAIIGYIQNEDGKYWHYTINNWIQELIDGKMKSPLNWFSSDLLFNTCNFQDLRLVKSISESEKTNQTKISLNHYFVDLCK
ncbi:hypothetical protein [Flavobacterium chungangense]|uniref:Uncharacterized protein n=1 Tax=Flavobacterium chungangense TaxID=554283 RepID=A0A6V6ZDZ1_9FLAO|nr:hypothetical protein [Flavobacterium chungangense]CAD0010003.1 hypothetical protein FLACHUCJ7_04643 [Flavobacterium chungangense]